MQLKKFQKNIDVKTLPCKGYIEQQQNIYIFYEKKDKNTYKKISNKNEWWWSLMDEICNIKYKVTVNY